MILFGCLLAFSAAVAPRLVLILAWIFSDRWPVVWQGDWILPLLGIIFLPYTTIMYLLAWSPAVGGSGNIEGWDWMWIIIGIFLDIMKWGQMLANRKEATKQTQKYYPSGAPRGGAAAAAVAAPAAPTRPAAPAEPAAPAAPAEPAPEPATPAAPAEPEPAAPAEPAPEPAAPAAGSAKLDELEQMRASGALTDEEYEAAKAKLQG